LDGSPSGAAVVVSSAGGRAVADLDGRYRLEAWIPFEAESVQLTAVGRGRGSRVASVSVDVTGRWDGASIDPLRLASGGECEPEWVPTFGGRPGTGVDVRAL